MTTILGRIGTDLKLQRIILIISAFLAAISLAQGCRNAYLVSQDFQWDAAKALSLKINPYDESINPSGALEPYGFEEYYLQMEANQFPSLLLLLFPYTLLPPLAARYAWLLSNLFFTAGIVFLLRKTFLRAETGIGNFEFIFSMLITIAGTPYRNQLGVGQHTLFAFFFFLSAVYCIEKKSESSSLKIQSGSVYKTTDTSLIPGEKLNIGASLALFVCYFKYTLTVPLVLYFVYKKRYKEILLSVFLHIILTAYCADLLNDSFINMIIKPLKVSSRLSAEGGLDFGALLNGSFVSYILSFITMAGLLAFTLHAMRRSFPENVIIHIDSAVISVLILWSMILTYHRTYDFFVIITVLSFMHVPKCPAYIRILYSAALI
ncbi:MAG: glycosyltransferase 87 family protein, partial [Lachnospiraceae bacterium]|nr:glycosyltransferase 87 family protein [Lachnospiraceae bacterium]